MKRGMRDEVERARALGFTGSELPTRRDLYNNLYLVNNGTISPSEIYNLKGDRND